MCEIKVAPQASRSAYRRGVGHVPMQISSLPLCKQLIYGFMGWEKACAQPRTDAIISPWVLEHCPAIFASHSSGVFFTKGICARNIFKSWKMVPKANPENFVKIWSPEEEIWGFKDVRRCRFYFMDVNHSSSKRATNDSHKEHLHTLTLILMALVRPKVNSNGIKSIFRYFCMILFLH